MNPSIIPPGESYVFTLKQLLRRALRRISPDDGSMQGIDIVREESLPAAEKPVAVSSEL